MGIDTVKLMVEERERQFSKGYSRDRDEQYDSGELLHAALAYICTPGDVLWPFATDRYHPSSDPISNIVTAGALLAAEGDRLQRRRRFGLPIASGMIVLSMNSDDVAGVVEGLREVNKAAQELKNLCP